MGQKAAILSHLTEGKSITPLEALSLFGCFRLSARINELRDEGYPIRTNKVQREGKTFAQYQLTTR